MENQLIQHKNKWYIKSDTGYLEIISTTDPKLTLQNELNAYYKNGIGGGNKIPQIPQSFIEEYCKAGGIDRVMVEVEEIIVQDAFKRRPDYNTYRVKTDSNNCIIIHPVEEDKILTALQKFWNSAVIESTVKYSDLDKWIKENL